MKDRPPEVRAVEGPPTTPPFRRPKLLYREVIDSIDPDFSRAYALYEKTFPLHERVSRDYFVVALEAKRAGRLSPSNFRFLVCREGDEVGGFCTGRYLHRANVGFVGYLAVDPERKSRGIGSRLRYHLVKGFRRDAELAGNDDLEAVVGEVEIDNTWLSILVGRRRVFPLDFPYEQPPIPPETEPTPLVLYYQPIHAASLPAALPTERVRDLVHDIYRSVYRMEVPSSNPVYQRLMRHLEGKTSVGPLDLEKARRAAKGVGPARGRRGGSSTPEADGERAP